MNQEKRLVLYYLPVTWCEFDCVSTNIASVYQIGIRAITMSDLQLIGGVKKLNHQNYNTWATYLSSYLQGQDLWEIVQGHEAVQPDRETQERTLRKWRIKAGKAMFILKTTVEEELLDHIKDAVSPKQAWDTLAEVLSKKNDVRLQLLENELFSITQKELSIAQYFHKVKTLCREIADLDQQSVIGDARMKRIIIHGLRAEYRSFVAAVQGWPVQPSLGEFENLLASQEALAKQMGSVTIGSTSKTEDEVLYAEKGKGKLKVNYNKPGYAQKGANRFNDKNKRHEHGERKTFDADRGESSGERKTHYNNKRFPYKCYKCGYKGHMAKNCRVKLNDEGNTATVKNDDGWDAEALVAQVEDAEVFNVITENRRNRLDEWIVDSGCSNHLTGDKERLKNPIVYGGSKVVTIDDNSKYQIAHIGDVVFSSEGGKQDLVLKNVYHVPGMRRNLISVSQMTEEGSFVVFGPKDVRVFKNIETSSVPILKGRKSETMYVLNTESAYVEKTKGNQTTELWHQRLGHVGLDKLSLIVKQKLLVGLPNLEVQKDGVCSGCQYGKAIQLPFKSSEYKAATPLELVHTDVFGPVKQPSIQGLKFMVSFIDDSSRFAWIYFMKEKSEVFSKFKQFELDAELMTGYKVRCLRSDNGGEYMSIEFGDYLRRNLIKRQLTCPNTPQQNGVSERKNRHLGKVTRCLIHSKNLPGRFWAEAMRAACYVINRVPSQSLGYVSPYEKLTRSKPNVSYLRVFGCVCYVFIPAHLRHKMEKKAVRCVFVGYDSHRKGWRCCDPNSGKVYVSRNVIFDEQSSWWSPENQVLADSQQLKQDLENSRVILGDTLGDMYDESDATNQSISGEVNENNELGNQGDDGPRRSQRVATISAVDPDLDFFADAPDYLKHVDKSQLRIVE
ncbi:hypothetical protein E3N88_41413 [Mikania micrantha]|uniref:Integrase catalytic domain-containing protein n=1 Tax=Mikania micrantha TaxID=192012 RepID=A0A5N6LQL6_9ASTR|nr:hypothetical protein E3N88_41413 [Mikania micrantha]